MCRTACRNDFGKGHITHDQKVDVTVLSRSAAGKGPEEERDIDAVIKGGQRSPKDIADTGGLYNEPLQLGKDRAAPVGVVVNLPAALNSLDDPRIGEALEFPLNRPLASVSRSHDFAHVERLLRAAEQKAQD